MFKKYPSLTNHYESKFVNNMIMNGHTSGDWVAREKIHGTNFSFICKDGVEVIPAKRTGEILPSESFYGYELIKGRYYEAVKKLWKLLEPSEGEELTIQVFGEFAGEGIQKNIDYGPKEFYVFDLMVNGLIVPDRVMSVCCRFCGFKIAPLIGLGTFEELKKLPVTFVSVVKQNELDAIPIDSGYFYGSEALYSVKEADENATNIAEGYVLKPVIPVFTDRGERVALKCKSPKFSEKKNSSSTAFKAPSTLNEFDSARLELMTQYINENRVESVLSKMDRSNLTAKDFGPVMGLTVKDALEEIERNHGLFENNFEDPVLAKRLFTKHASDVVRSMWQGILNPETV